MMLELHVNEIIEICKETDSDKYIYIYDGCTGNLYVADELLDYDQRYCGQCGDSDVFVIAGYPKDILVKCTEELLEQIDKLEDKIWNSDGLKSIVFEEE